MHWLPRVFLLAISFLFQPGARSAELEIIYDNTENFLEHYAGEKTEFGDELTLAGTNRTLKKLSFEYFGEFAQQGDEFVKVRIYKNEKVYDLYRKEPTTLLYESGFFGINPGYNTRRLNLDVVVPDIVTVTFEFFGLSETETAGVLLYDPPTIGMSWNEFWRKNEAGIWQPIIYSTTDPTMKAKAGIRLEAAPTVRLNSMTVSDGKVNFDLSGLSGLTFVIESSTDLKTWTPVSTLPITAVTGAFSESTSAGQPIRFYRARLP